MITSIKFNFWKKNSPTSRKELKKFRRFIIKNRGWLCLEVCKVGPECEFCVLIFQINYSYSCNKKADIITFRNSVMVQTFDRLYDIYQDYKVREKWTSYENNWIKQNSFKIYVINERAL